MPHEIASFQNQIERLTLELGSEKAIHQLTMEDKNRYFRDLLATQAQLEKEKSRHQILQSECFKLAEKLYDINMNWE